MAPAAFKSTTRRAAVGGADGSRSSGSAGAHRRSRSLSRGPGRFPPGPPAGSDELPAPLPRGRFVNTVRGSGFPEISLDDLADEFFTGRDFEEELERERGGGRSGRRLSDASFLMDTESSRRRGRSVSRKGSSFQTDVGVRAGFDGSARRRRSVSLARNRCSDSERHSSTLTDDESKNACTKNNGYEKTIGTVYDRKKTDHPVGDGEVGLYEAMRKEVRYVVDEIRTGLEKVILKTKPAIQNDGNNYQPEGSDVVQAISEIRRNYTTKLEESEKRRQELLAELAAEEQRGQELTKIVKELLPGTKQTVPGKPFRFRKRSNDRTRMSKHLTEDAEKYFEDFISSVEDTDISSFDGERSDGSSTLGGSIKSCARAEGQACLAKSVSSPAEIDGLVLPWLKWETCNDGTPLSCKSKEAHGLHESVYPKSSRGSWSPGDNGSHSVISKDKTSNNIGEAGCCTNSDTEIISSITSFDMDEYMHLQHSENFLFEGLRQRQRIESGGLVLCGRNFVSY
ncbi:hypothetical protein Taro_040430 [Colocasia esculenta]|uniref:Uncharacterized protein n=1 Tax=Colocasia esculenta TaxID=4460 RepID=A0A843WYE5_COLES|nr:hypothetical protein [Colocasia esculenta]